MCFIQRDIASVCLSSDLREISQCFRRQTAEEREQERQAATKYFLSMQMGSMAAAAAAAAVTTTPAAAASPLNLMEAGFDDLPDVQKLEAKKQT